MDKFLDVLTSFTGTGIAIIILIIVFYAARRFFMREGKVRSKHTFIWQLVSSLIVFVGTIIIVVVLPIDREVKGQIIGLIGIIMSAAFALSSTTLFSNAFAGIMNSTIKNFNLGDFIRVGDYFGRVSKRGLFHTEIQTEDRNLTSIPNLFIATNPVNITRESGTIISMTVSLGYDVSKKITETALLEAAKNAKLNDAFVFITDLGDFSVSYKIHGLLKDINNYFTAQSTLKKRVLESLHSAKIEIVSPAFMNQRKVTDTVFIPKVSRKKEPEISVPSPEKLIFDKALKAGAIEDKNELLTKIGSQLTELKSQIKETGSDEKKVSLNAKLERLEAMQTSITKRLETDKSKLDELD